MGNQKMEALEEAHGMVHDICFNIGNGNTDEAKTLLKSLDMLLHDAIHQEGLAHKPQKEDIFNTIASAIKP